MGLNDRPHEIVDLGPSAARDPLASWWTEKDEKRVHEHVFGVVRSIESESKTRHQMLADYYRAYMNRVPTFMQRGIAAQAPVSTRVSFNVTQSCVDTVWAKVAKNNPRPLILTSGGHHDAQRKAQLLTRYLDGAFSRMKAFEVGKECFRDCGIFGDGIMYVYPKRGRVSCERVPVDELLVDECEGYYGQPRQIHRRRFMARSVLLQMFPDFADEIRKAPESEMPVSPAGTQRGMVTVIESWHLPSLELMADDEFVADGRHAISIEGRTLFCEEYRKNYFPFARIQWNPGVVGFFGRGLAEELAGIQAEIDAVVNRISTGQLHMCAPKILVDERSEIIDAAWNNDVRGVIIKHTGMGTPPRFIAPNAMSPEVYNYLEMLMRRAYELTGVAQTAAKASKPGGVIAAEAIREVNDIETERFVLQGQRWEQFFLEIARMVIDISKDLYEDNPKLSVQVRVSGRAGKFIQSIPWSDVDMADEEFEMDVYPTSILPTQPQAKLQKVTEMIQAGVWTKEQGFALLDFPDLPDATSLYTSSYNSLRKRLDAMIDDGKYRPPEPFDNQSMARELALETYHRGVVEDVEDARLELVRSFLADLATLAEKNQTPKPTPAPGPGGPGVPMAGPAGGPPPPPPGMAAMPMGNGQAMPAVPVAA